MDNATRYGAEKEEYAEKYIKQQFEIQSMINKVSSDKFALGMALKELWKSGHFSYRFLTKGLFNIFVGTSANKNLSSKAFYAVCEFDFGLDRSSVSRLVNVVDEFCDERGQIKEEYKKYKYSVLCEMLPLSIKQREKISLEWTVSQVRDYKKYLASTLKAEACDIGVVVEKPVDEYAQFKDWKRIDFCKRIMSLEVENRELQAELEKYRKAKKNVKKN